MPIYIYRENHGRDRMVVVSVLVFTTTGAISVYHH